jgi:hypothetical protein
VKGATGAAKLNEIISRCSNSRAREGRYGTHQEDIEHDARAAGFYIGSLPMYSINAQPEQKSMGERSKAGRWNTPPAFCEITHKYRFFNGDLCLSENTGNVTYTIW